MWPQTLEMTRDECRAILRRLELDSYSRLISTFRAQGALNDEKSKLLADLRGTLHITQERHRVEARRAVNDEELSTIAETLAGPNTWQEWSREGHRSLPLLPRVAPQTALSLIANNIAKDAVKDNLRLPMPSQTAAAKVEERKILEAHQRSLDLAADGTRSGKARYHILTEDPFKVPPLPVGPPKKNLKRHVNDSSHHYPTYSSPGAVVSGSSSGGTKKRHTADHAMSNKPYSHNNNNHLMGSPKKLNNTHQKSQYQQQGTKHKSPKKMATLGTANQQGRPKGSIGRISKKKLMQQRQSQMDNAMDIDLELQQLQVQQHTNFVIQQQFPKDIIQFPVQSQIQQPQVGRTNIMELMPSPMTTAPTTILQQPQEGQPHHQPPQQQPQIHQHQHVQEQPQDYLPQIAASKKDISKNLTKLQILAATSAASSPLRSGGAGGVLGGGEIPATAEGASPETIGSSKPMTPPHLPPGTTIVPQSSLPQSLPPSSTSLPSTITATIPFISKVTTPVQKYIVEDRQPPPVSQHLSAGVQTSTVTPSMSISQTTSSAPHVVHLPQLTTTSTFSTTLGKLRVPLSTTILPPGTKITAKRLSSKDDGQQQQHQFPSLIAGVGSNSSGSGVIGTATATHTPTHSAPAVLQIQGSIQSGETASQSQQQQPHGIQTQRGKVMTTRMVPIVFNSTGSGSGGGLVSSSTTTTTSNATVYTLSSASGMSPVNTTFIKTLPSAMIISSRRGSSIVRTSGGIAGGATTPKIFKPVGANSSGAAPQILSNIRIAPPVSTNESSGTTSVSSTLAASSSSSLPVTSMAQLKTGTFRAGVKICQSSNGRVFIQSASTLEGGKPKLTALQGSPRIVPTAKPLTLGSTGAGALSSSEVTKQKVTIQKVEYLPPLSLASQQQKSQAQQKAQFTAKPMQTINKNNLVLMTGTSNPGTRTFTLSRNNVAILAKNLQAQQNQQQPQQQTNVISGSANVMIIGSKHVPKTTIAKATAPPTATTATKAKTSKVMAVTITEDTPVDIVDVSSPDGASVVSGDNAPSYPLGVSAGSYGRAETITVLPSSTIETTTASSEATSPPVAVEAAEVERDLADASNKQTIPTSSNTVIIGATDWEMELDQAVAASASSSNQQQQHQSKSRQISQDGVITFEDTFEDVIIVDADNEVEQQQKSSSVLENAEEVNDADNIVKNDQLGDSPGQRERERRVLLGSHGAEDRDDDDTKSASELETNHEEEEEGEGSVKRETKGDKTKQKTSENENDAGFDETMGEMEVIVAASSIRIAEAEGKEEHERAISSLEENIIESDAATDSDEGGHEGNIILDIASKNNTGNETTSEAIAMATVTTPATATESEIH